MCHLSQADTAETEVAVVTSCAAADLASVVVAHGELLVLSHFCNPCFSSHKVLFLLFSSRFAEGHTHIIHEQATAFIVAGRGNERNVHTVGFG